MANKTLKTGKLFRYFEFDREKINKETRTVELSFSSESPVDRWFGIEKLDHNPQSIRLSRINTGGPLLLNHNTNDQIGVIEQAVVGADRKGRAVVRFGKNPQADQIFNDVIDGIRKNVSVGYQIHQMILESETEGISTYRATDWEPLEISIVSVPADINVGVGREAAEFETRILTTEKMEVRKMADEAKTEEQKKIETPQINVDAVRSKAAEEERERVREIFAIGEKFKQLDMARKYVDEGKSIGEFRMAVLERMGHAKPINNMDADIGMSKKEVKEFSFLRAIRSMAYPNEKGFWEDAAFEREASIAVAKKFNKTPQGFFIPNDVLKRDLVVGTATAGGNLVATDLLAANFIELLRNRMQVRAMGATILDGLVGNVAIPKATGGATAYWVAENGAPTESQQTIGQVTLSPKTVGAFTDIARQLLLQSSLDVEAFVRNDLAAVLALAIDLAAINGSGASNQPTGILNTSGIGDAAIGTNGGAPTYAACVELETDVSVANADVAGMALLSTPEMRGKLKQTARFSSTDTPVWEPNNTVNGYPAFVSNQVPKTLTKGTSSDCHAIIFGNWRDLMIGQWGGLDLLVDPYTGGAAGTVRIRVLQSIDIAVRNAVSFSACKDARNI